MDQLLYILIWWGCGLIGAGFVFAENQAEQGDWRKVYFRRDLGFAITMSFLGVVSLILCFLLTGFGESGWWGFKRK